jgi:hypothetical protein
MNDEPDEPLVPDEPEVPDEPLEPEEPSAPPTNQLDEPSLTR